MNLVIKDSTNTSIAESFDQLILWRSYHDAAFPDAVSIPKLVEKNASSLRDRYLNLIHDFGEIKVGSSKLYQKLKLRPGFSYWWMTLFTEKCNFAKSPQITNVIRLFAFDEWAAHKPQIKSIKLVTAESELQDCLKKWCHEKKIHFECQKTEYEIDTNTGFRKLLNYFPHIIQAVVWLLKYLFDRWSLCGVGIDAWKKGSSGITFISYLFNLKSKAIRAGRFDSNYWTELSHVLDKQEVRSNWLHLYVKNTTLPTAKSAKKLLQNFNEKYKGKQVHVALDSFMSLRTIIGTILDYFLIQRISRSSIATVSKFPTNKNQVMESLLWPLFKKDWQRSFYGIDAMHNSLTLNLFEEAFSNLPKQSVGVYLQENQGWEFGMIHTWKSNSHGRLIGFPSFLCAVLDLRYFFDRRNYNKKDLSLPMPNNVAVSGDAIKRAYVEGGYPQEDLVEVEALRYLHLDKSIKKKFRLKSSFTKRRQVLVVGDYLPSNTTLQMNFLREIVDEISNIELTVKAHPACPIDASDYPELKFKVLNKSLSDIENRFDIAFTSSLTSASLDAYCAGLIVVSVLDPTTLNLSPLRGIKEVRFISSAKGLRHALLEERLQNDKNENRVKFFNINSSLACWKALISSNLNYIKH